MAKISPYILMITLNKNGLNSLIIRPRMAEWIKKQDPMIYCLQETCFSLKDAHRDEKKDISKQMVTKTKTKQKQPPLQE